MNNPKPKEKKENSAAGVFTLECIWHEAQASISLTHLHNLGKNPFGVQLLPTAERKDTPDLIKILTYTSSKYKTILFYTHFIRLLSWS